MKERETQAAASWRFVATRTTECCGHAFFMKPSLGGNAE
jgi:hypothetical protein